MIYKYYLFDLDGVLINTDNIQYNSTKEAIYNTCKYDISSKDDINIFKSTITTRKKLEYLVNRKVIKDNDVEKIYSLKKSIANEKFEKITIDKKKIELFEFLKDNDCKIAVITNSNKNSANIILKHIGIYKYIDYFITNEDVVNSKPHSEPYIKAMIKFGGDINEYIIFEDSEIGLISAHGTGCKVYEVKNSNDVNLDLIKSLNNINDDISNINIVIPMAGLGNRFKERNFKTLKPLLKIKNATLIEYAINTLDINGNYIFIIRKNNEDIKNILKKIKKDCKIIEIDYLTEGSASSCYLAKDYINNNNELIISNCDQILEWSSERFLNKTRELNLDCSVLTYLSDSNKNSYIKVDNANLAYKIQEKDVISNNALVGVHYFKKGSLFIKSYEEIYQNRIKIKDEYYISTVCNNLIKDCRVGHVPLNYHEKYHSTGTPEDYFKYLRYIGKLNIKKENIATMMRGWYIGDFEPSVYKTSDFEVGYLLHKKGEQWDVHYHEHMIEINLLIKGTMILNDMEMNE